MSSVGEPDRIRPKTQSADVVRREQRRVVRLAVVAGTEDDLQADLDAVTAERPRLRGHCEPVQETCPWCDAAVVMRKSPPANGKDPYVECPSCTKRVVHRGGKRGHDGNWERYAAGLESDSTQEAHSAALNRCRPCIWASCPNHLYMDVNRKTGAIKLNFPHLEVWEVVETCALDIAERKGTTLEDIGRLTNLTRERIRQLELVYLAKLKRALEAMGVDGPVPALGE